MRSNGRPNVPPIAFNVAERWRPQGVDAIAKLKVVGRFLSTVD